MDELRALLAQKRVEEARRVVDAAVAAAAPDRRAGLLKQAAAAAVKAGEPRLAAELFGRAGELAPGDPEPRHDRGIALLELGQVGLAAQAQAEALALDPDHAGARAQRAAALEALGDDEGAAQDLAELLARIGPQPALQVRLEGLREAARRAAHRSLLGLPVGRLSQSPLVGSAFAPSAAPPPLASFRAPFADLEAVADGQGRVRRLTLLFDSMDASLARTDLSYGGSTEDEHGRRVPLDEFTAAATVFLAQGLGIEAERASRLLRFLLAPECGLGPVPVAAARVGWVIDESRGDRHYGLFVVQGRSQ